MRTYLLRLVMMFCILSADAMAEEPKEVAQMNWRMSLAWSGFGFLVG